MHNEKRQPWISIDPANTSGWAQWEGTQLLSSGIITKVGAKGKWRVNERHYEREFYAWNHLLLNAKQCVCEVGRGSFRNADLPLGKRLGYIRAVCDLLACEYQEVALAEWRRILRDQTGLSWPTGKDAKKTLSIKYAKELYGVTASEDEADAILVGHAWIRSGRAPEGE
jgi:hypothetical protein